MAEDLALRPEQLYRRTDPASLGFDTTAELPPLVGAIGQAEGMAALEFGVSMRGGGYNIFVLGESGSGRRSFVLEALHRRAEHQAPPPDWCYVQNFTDVRRPRAVCVAAGRGPELERDVALVIDDLRRLVPQALEADESVARRTAAVEARERQAAELLSGARVEAEAARAQAVAEAKLLLQRAQRDADAIIADAREQFSRITLAASEEAVRIRTEAETEAAELKRKADLSLSEASQRSTEAARLEAEFDRAAREFVKWLGLESKPEQKLFGRVLHRSR